MKIVNATWEQRNMGVNCVEITLERQDIPEQCVDVIKSNEAEYTVLKIPVPMTELGMMIEDMGFHYMETMFSLRRNTEKPFLSKAQEQLVKDIDYLPMTAEDHKRLFKEVRDGMFKTDRVSLDPAFREEQSNERYVGWIKDEIGRGTDLFKLRYKEEDTGFFAFKKVRDGVFLPFLAGIYPNGVKVFGLGYALCYMEIMEANKRLARTILGSVSSNNIASLAALTSFGYIIDGAEAVFVKHKSKQDEEE